MTDVGIRVYFLFERRKSLAHKWILVPGYNNVVPKCIEDVSSISFTPSQWNYNNADSQGMFLLASLLAGEKSCCNADEMPFIVHLETFKERNSNMFIVQVNCATNIAVSTQALIFQCGLKKAIVSKSSLALHDLFQFIDDLEQNTEAKRNHSILRLICQHMELKLCSLKYPEVRVHFIVALETKQILPLQITHEVEEIVQVQAAESQNAEDGDAEEPKKKEEEDEEKEKQEEKEREEEEKERREEKEREEEEKKRQEEKEREEEEEKKRQEEKDQTLQKLLAKEHGEREEAQKRHLLFIKEEEERCKRLADECRQQAEAEQEKRRLQILEQEAREKKRIQEMELARKKQEEKRFEEQRRIEREHRLLEEQRMLEKQKRDLEAEKEKQKLEAERREKECRDRENRLKKEAEITHRHELSVADVYDFSGDGWEIDNIDFATSDFSVQSNVYCPLPSLEQLYQVPPMDAEKPQTTTTPAVEKTTTAVICDTMPTNVSFLPKNVILAISEVKEETRSVTRWMQRKLCAMYPENKYSLCFISQNFSESDCASVQQFVAQKNANREWVVIGVECEFSPIDPLSRECTTLLNEFDGRTSLLILELIGMPNTTVVFETTKHFNHVWCWKYNLINTPSSQWFAKASKTGDFKDLTLQHQAHSAAMIRLVTYASDQAAAVVRCSNQSAAQKETYFDYVILGCNANNGETKSLFTFINEQRVQQKLQNQRWKRRISNLLYGDALAIPLSHGRMIISMIFAVLQRQRNATQLQVSVDQCLHRNQCFDQRPRCILCKLYRHHLHMRLLRKAYRSIISLGILVS